MPETHISDMKIVAEESAKKLGHELLSWNDEFSCSFTGCTNCGRGVIAYKNFVSGKATIETCDRRLR